jgi:hypothetical protein
MALFSSGTFRLYFGARDENEQQDPQAHFPTEQHMKSVSVLITTLLLILLGVVIATDVEDGWFGAGDDGALGATAPHAAGSLALTGYENGNRGLTEGELRGIIREELAAYSAGITTGRTLNNRGSDAGRPGAPPGSKEFERIDQQVDEYISMGAISDAEMAALHEELGRLDAAARRQLLGKIVRAMNSGALKGNL